MSIVFIGLIPLLLSAKTPERIRLSNVVNSKFGDLAPSVSADGKLLLFQSNRPGGKGSYDLYICQRQGNAWGEPENIGAINSPFFDGLASLSPDGRSIYFSSNRPKSGKKAGNMNIFVSRYENDLWSKPEIVKNINTSAYEAMPALAFDGSVLYFTSSRSGGEGGQDIYFATKKENGEWNKPKNMGPIINTSDNEMNPNVPHGNQLFYFASDRDGGMGGYDLYYTKKMSNGKWEPPVNIGIPVNNEEDQFFFTMPATGEFVLTSSGKTSQHNEDIYRLIIPDWLRPVPVAIFRGTVRNAQTAFPTTANITVERVVGKKSTAVMVKPTLETGDYLLVLKTEELYRLGYRKKGFFYVLLEADLRQEQQALERIVNVDLNPIEPGTKVLEDMVYFKTGGAGLTDESKIALETLITLMQRNPEMRIEIKAYADRRGVPRKNRRLSLQRARQVKDYLANAGVESQRMVAKGGGIVGPKVRNTVHLSQKVLMKLQQARRVDFTVLGE